MARLSAVALMFLGSAALAWNSPQPQQPVQDPLEFVSTEHTHGVPYDEARALGDGAVPVLIDALRDPKFTEWRTNVVVTLGFLGSRDAADPLIAFLEKTTGKVDDETFGALLAVPPALGDIARLSGDPKGDLLSYLARGSRLGLWGQKAIGWSALGYEGGDLHRQLATSSIAGLGRVASNGAMDALRRLDRELSDPQLKRRVADALALSNRIRAQGAAEAFSSRKVGALKRQLVETAAVRAAHELTVSRHINASMDDAKADDRFSSATAFLARNDSACAGEVACDVELERRNPVDSYGVQTDGLDLIDDAKELSDVFALPANIKVVRKISWCGDQANNFSGCTTVGQENVIVVAGASSETWAHEFGHTKGVSHRPATDCPQWIMSTGVRNRRAIDVAECGRLRRP